MVSNFVSKLKSLKTLAPIIPWAKKNYDFDFFHSYESLRIGLLLEYILKSVRLQKYFKEILPMSYLFF